MNTPILELTNISKQYRLGYVGTGNYERRPTAMVV